MVETILLIIVISCTVSLIIIQIYDKFMKKKVKYYIPFGNKNFYFDMTFDEMFDIEVPYRQKYLVKKEILYAYYKTEIDYIYSIIKYTCIDQHGKIKILKAVEIELECDNFIDAKNTMSDVKDMILKFYKSKTTYNEFEENKKERTFHNSFGIKTIDFNIDINNNMLILTMKIK